MPDYDLPDTVTICRGNVFYIPDHPLDFGWTTCSNCNSGNDELYFFNPGHYNVRYGPNPRCLIAQDSISVGIDDGSLKISGLTIQNTPCAGSAAGSVALELSGQANPVSYIWSNGATTSIIQHLPAGLYAVTVMDSLACRRDTFATITEPLPLSLTLTILHNAYPNQQVGILAALPSGGTPPYEFQWSNNAPSNDTIANLPGGTYSLTVVDANGCTASKSLFLPFDISGTEEGGEEIAVKLWPNPVENELSCTWDAPLSVIKVAITDLTGREIWHEITPKEKVALRVDDWPSGQYLLHINHQGGVWRKSFVVVR